MEVCRKEKVFLDSKNADGLTNRIIESEPWTTSKVSISGLITETTSFFWVSAGNEQGIEQYNAPVRVMSK